MTYKIEQDTDTVSPEDWGDEKLFLIGRHRDFTVDAPIELGTNEDQWAVDGYTRLALYAYIHSGVALSLGREYPFNCQWDSCQVGFIYVSTDPGEFGDTTPEQVAKGYVETWNQYLSGDVWGYTVEDAAGEHVDSCWGFYGREYCETEAKSALAACEQGRVEQERAISLCWAE